MNELSPRIRSASDFQALAEAVAPHEITALEPRDVAAAARKLAKLERPEPAVRIALLGTHTLDPLCDYLQVCGLREHRVVQCWVAPYGQYMQAVFPPADELARFDPDIVLLSAEMRGLSPRVPGDFASLSQDETDTERERLVRHLSEWAGLASQATRATILVANFPRPFRGSLGIADSKRTPSEAAFYLKLNLDLLEALRSRERVSLFDLDAIVSAFGGDRGWAPRTYFLAKQPWSPGLTALVARETWRHVIAAKGWVRKCLVVDLDNTIWGGVVGEDGPAGLRIGQGEADGEAFAEFQRTIRGLKARGVVLAVASKNNPEDVEAAFAERPEMPLGKDDFTVMEIGWHEKAASIRNIAATLDIGIDSLVFLDDNPAERAMVRGALPEVLVPDLPDDPALYAEFLRQQLWFEKPRVTEEDVAKARQYQDQAQRAALRAEAGDMERFLADLGTEVRIWEARPENVARVQQLYAKTNQFNVTTPRYSLGEVESFVRSTDHSLCIVSARDRFGDLGIIGVYLLEHRGQNISIDSFLMSCRALGRGIETAFMNALKDDARRRQPDGILTATFVPTRKNAPARGFFETQGLVPAATGDDGRVTYEAAVPELVPIPVPHIRVTCEPKPND
jgi:FkbH-like protein